MNLCVGEPILETPVTAGKILPLTVKLPNANAREDDPPAAAIRAFVSTSTFAVASLDAVEIAEVTEDAKATGASFIVSELPDFFKLKGLVAPNDISSVTPIETEFKYCTENITTVPVMADDKLIVQEFASIIVLFATTKL